MANNQPVGVAYADPQLASATFTPVAVASLPTASTALAGMRMAVNNSNAALTAGIGAVVAGGGSNTSAVATARGASLYLWTRRPTGVQAEAARTRRSRDLTLPNLRSEEHTSELQSH